MRLKKKYAKQEDIPAGFESLYTEVNGEYVLTEVDGLTSDADVARLTESLRKEREDHKKAKDAARAVTSVLESANISVDDLGGALDELSAFRESGTKPADTTKLNMEISQLRRTNADLTKSVEGLTTENTGFKQANTQRTIHDALSKAAANSGIKDVAVLEDIQLYGSLFSIDEATGGVVTRDGFMQPEVWLSDMKEKRPHWWPLNEGGGGTGGKGGPTQGANPWAAKTWNVTQQAQMYKENSTRAEQMAKTAGTTIGGPKPAQ